MQIHLIRNKHTQVVAQGSGQVPPDPNPLHGQSGIPGTMQMHLGGKKHSQNFALMSGLAPQDLAPPTPTWLCQTCKLPFGSPEALTQHNLSSSHARRSYLWLSEVHAGDSHLSQWEKSEPWRCHVCDVMCTGQKNLQVGFVGVTLALGIRVLLGFRV
jgi:hypothetical protein